MSEREDLDRARAAIEDMEDAVEDDFDRGYQRAIDHVLALDVWADRPPEPPTLDEELDPLLAAWFNARADAIRDVAAHRASPPEYPGMALVPVPLLDRLARYVELPRTRDALGASPPPPDLSVVAALTDLTAAYHHERKHEGRWDACQRPRCQNARLAIEGRGPFALLASQPPSTPREP